MPEEFVREMVADWMGAGIAQGKRGDIWNWWENHRDKIILHPSSRDLVNQIIYEELPKTY